MAAVTDPTDDLSALWAWFADEHCPGDSPLYERICGAVSADRELLEFVRQAPSGAHMPLTLLAAVHYLILDGLDHPLADVYAGRSDADPAPLFLDLCRTHRPELAALLAVRLVQTNDCGRSAAIGPGLTWLSSRLDEPFGLVDVGASAGINLLCDRYRIDYGDHGTTGPAGSPVEIACRVVAGEPPIADRLPAIGSRIGIDRAPIDLTDPDDARWLLACVWPDSDRLERTAASIGLARDDPPLVIPGNAVDTLPGVLADLPEAQSAVVVTTAAAGYFSIEQRRRFLSVLEAGSTDRSVAWLSAETGGVVEALADAAAPDHDLPDCDVLGALTFEGGKGTAHLLGFVHRHGAWMDWRGPPATPHR